MKYVQRLDLLEAVGARLQGLYSTTQINSLLRSLGITDGLEESVQSKRVYARDKLSVLEDAKLIDLAQQLDVPVPNEAAETNSSALGSMGESRRKVFVIHGRDESAREAMFTFLRAAGLDPIEWSEAVELTGKGTPYIGEILDHAFEEAAAVVVLLTPEDRVCLADEFIRPSDGPDEREYQLQPRPNVLFEAGMAFGRHPDRTVLVSIGSPKEFSDVAGRHVVRLTNETERRLDLLSRLKGAGCEVRAEERRDWLRAGDFRVERSEFARDVDWDDEQGNLGTQEVAVLALVANSDGIVADTIAGLLQISVVEAEHRLDVLEEREYVRVSYFVGRPAKYRLSKKGRAYAVENGIV